MLHWTPTPTATVAPVGFALSDRRFSPETARARHARMLAHVATRRRAAAGPDGAYWKAVAPAALNRATALRADVDFLHLP